MSRERFLAIWLRLLAVQEISMARDFYKILNNQAKKAATAFSAEGHPGAEKVIDETGDLIIRTLVAHYATTIRRFANFTSDYLGGKKADFQSLVQSFIAKEAIKKVKYINDTTKEKLRSIISTGNTQGLGVEKIASNIVSDMGSEFAKSRARTIARTETHMAAGFASNAQASQVDFKTVKTWVATEDERTRTTHGSPPDGVDGTTIDSDDAFEVGNSWLYYPGDPGGAPEEVINCRCAVVYEPKTPIFNEV